VKAAATTSKSRVGHYLLGLTPKIQARPKETQSFFDDLARRHNEKVPSERPRMNKTVQAAFTSVNQFTKESPEWIVIDEGPTGHAYIPSSSRKSFHSDDHR
jgi:hypothetical protein